ncbi:unnamed protein product [Thelazia callipaeda]|uniref:N_BRCA1_IG domain-containing protein n=1 Tax=Thelazia callipaeda TaxID=103827 RepID=A0A0N5CZY9_THECL|nr:unnamed protein product [Thelazia callipaeda]
MEMDIDGDVNGALSQALSCMATSDRDVLIKQFQQILGDDHVLSDETCAFFLDMNSWNLQAALGAYYDYGSANGTGSPPPEYVTELPSMQFVQDVTIGEGESVPPCTRFIKTWRIRNSGKNWWPSGCFLTFMEGDKLSDTTRCWIQQLPPGKEINVSIEMVSPAANGIYQSRWQLNTSSGIPFGGNWLIEEIETKHFQNPLALLKLIALESIWCIITVDDMGILDITQQLASAPLGTSVSSEVQNINPFGGVLSFNSGLQGEQYVIYEDNMLMQEEDENSSLSDTIVNQIQGAWPVDDNQRPDSMSEPTDVSHDEEASDVPPCTPCTPPQ